MASVRRLALILAALFSSSAYTHAGAPPEGRAGRSEAPAQTERNTQAKPALWIIPHTHWEGAVFKTREEYLEIGLPHILTALHLLKAHPNYRFALDQVAYVRPFLERYPEEEAAFRKFVAEGRLQIVGGTDVMLDVNMPSGESWIRQVLYGKGYYRDKLGVDVTVGWALDTFGHHAQMPQLLKLAGYKSYWFQRGVRSLDVPSEFLWQGIDGTQIPAFWLAQGYGLFYDSPKDLADFEAFATGAYDSLAHFSRGGDRVALAGEDVSEPEDHLPILVDQVNQKGDLPFSLRFAAPNEFETVIARRGERPTVSGELNPVFQGIYSSRIELKQWMRNDERLLTAAEKLATLAAWLGAPSHIADINRAWEPVLFNQAHDLASGTIVDKVYEDTIHGYQFSKRLGDETVETLLDDIFSRVDTSGAGVPIAVFNTLGWPRTDLAEANVGFSESGVFDVGLLDSSGQAVPIQPLETERHPDGSIRRARIAFIAHDVPALGYSIYHLVSGAQKQHAGERRPRFGVGSSTSMHQDQGSIENEFYRATFDLWTGEMTSLVVKAGGWEALSGPGNVVAREQDGGDFWELEGTLNGARFTAMTRHQPRPRPLRSHLSSEFVGGSGVTQSGPVFSQFQVSHPFGSGSFATRVRLYPGVRRIDFQTQILNNEQSVRYRVLFPGAINGGVRVDEIPFGAVERPSAQEFPAQNWIDYSDRSRGVALLNHGLPGNNVADGTLMLSLMRSARITAYPFFGGYEPGVSSDLGLELGKQMTFDYSLMPHAGDWRDAAVYRAGMEFNHPLIVRKVTRHAGLLPPRWGWIDLSHPNVVVSALKPALDGSAVLRVYEASGRPTAGVRVKFQPEIAAADEVNLMEAPVRKLDVRNGALEFDLGPYEIKTLKVQLQPWKKSK